MLCSATLPPYMQAFFLVSAIFLALLLYHFACISLCFRLLGVVEERLIISSASRFYIDFPALLFGVPDFFKQSLLTPKKFRQKCVFLLFHRMSFIQRCFLRSWRYILSTPILLSSSTSLFEMLLSFSPSQAYTLDSFLCGVLIVPLLS